VKLLHVVARVVEHRVLRTGVAEADVVDEFVMLWITVSPAKLKNNVLD